MTTLWDTNGGEVVKALSAERRSAGAVAFGIVLTLVVIVEEGQVEPAMAAAAVGAAAHPCRLLVVVRRQPDAAEPRLDAEVRVGGGLGAGEAVVLRMYGPLARHAESVVLPLLAPDTPVVTWWHGPPPERISDDCLGPLADRRITDTARAPDPLAALRQRAADYSPGDTDLAWTRVTPWRSLLAAAMDSMPATPTAGTVRADPASSSAALLVAWLTVKLAIDVRLEAATGPRGITGVELQCTDGEDTAALHLHRPDGRTAVLTRTGQPDRPLPMPRRQLGELIGEELQRLDPDEPYAEALAGAFGPPAAARGAAPGPGAGS